jgi:hypothetical protein
LSVSALAGHLCGVMMNPMISHAAQNDANTAARNFQIFAGIG